jgi:hypothetical protein
MAKLVAMVGERLRVPGYREVSGVCTHPEYSRRGYASAPVAATLDTLRNLFYAATEDMKITLKVWGAR